jgi:multicomponent K+:H+ antiporter subunit E/multicomponent Na+:H+ antiporter subunit E
VTARLIAVGMLTLVYALVLASLALWDLLIGAAISTALLLLLRPRGVESGPGPAPHLLVRVAAFLPFAVAVARDVLNGTWSVALIALGLRPARPSGIVEVPIGDRTDSGVVVTSLVSTLSPGAVLIDVDMTRRVMLFHVLGSDPEEFRSSQETLYGRYQRWVFP